MSTKPTPAVARVRAVRSYPDAIEIEPRRGLRGELRAPGSKSITNRALLVAALADGESRLSGGLESDDTLAMQGVLRALGAGVETGAEPWLVAGRGGRWRAPAGPLWTENSGTTARFVTAAATLAPAPVVVDGNARMRERPIDPLVNALGELGARVDIEGRDGCPPVRVHGGGLPGGVARIDARRTSSQHVSAILLSAPYAASDVELRPQGGVVISRPYVDLTLQVMRDFGAEAGWTETGALRVRAGRHYTPRDYAVEADASSAVYGFCAAAVTGGRVRVPGLPKSSAQADLAILGLLERMGCRVRREGDTIEVEGPQGPLRSAGEVDMNDLPDAALAYAVVALFADAPTRIVGVPNLRIKETDRLAALETELRRLGAGAEAGPDWLRIVPGPLHGASIETYDDHRIAMSFALAGLRVPGVVIRDPGCVSKTWPDFFEAFGQLEGV